MNKSFTVIDVYPPFDQAGDNDNFKAILSIIDICPGQIIAIDTTSIPKLSVISIDVNGLFEVDGCKYQCDLRSGIIRKVGCAKRRRLEDVSMNLQSSIDNSNENENKSMNIQTTWIVSIIIVTVFIPFNLYWLNR